MQIVERTFSPADAFALMKQGVPAVLARMWSARKVKSASEGNGDLSALVPYTALHGAERFATIVADAIQEGKRLLIVADYDADGATACTVGVRALREFGANVGYLIPNRLEHGYGLTPEIVEEAARQEPRPDYIITVDNGISSIAGVALANQLGIPVLVTDHHLAGPTLPDAMVIVNPNQPACSFPSKALAGCGVMWYCMWALQEELLDRGLAPSNEFHVNNLLPIVAVGTVADVVTLDTNNRILVHNGLQMIRHCATFPGLEELAKISTANPRELATTDIAFGIGPRINAAGRLDSMDAGVECLTTDSVARAKFLAGKLHEINGLRKEIEGETVEQAVRQLLTEVPPDRYTAVLHSPEWHQGVIGIVAGRLKEKLFRPTFILASGKEGELKGSGRSIPGFHLRDALDLVDKRCPGLLLKFGGHAMAAGLTLRPGGRDEFADAFEAVAREMLRPSDLLQVIETDGSLETGEINLQTVSLLRMQVWGQMFPEPTFCDVFKVLEARRIGEGKHLKLTLEKGGMRFHAVRFRYDGSVPEGRIRAVYKIASNTFKEEVLLQLVLDYFEQA
jgi:single-stranded-DNA-specific exonuclease